MKKSVLLIIILAFMVSGFLSGATVNFQGLVQTWFSYVDDDLADSNLYGFTLRRVRLHTYGELSKTIKWCVFAGWDRQQAKLLDAFLDFNLSPEFKIKVGQFKVPGVSEGYLLPSKNLDFIEHSSITQKWSENSGLSSYRALGVEARGELMSGKIHYALMVANPRTLSYYFPTLKQPTHEHEYNGISIWGRIEATPLEELRFGAWINTVEESNQDATTNSYGVHLFYKKRKLNFKIEYVAGERESNKYSGMYALVGYRLSKKVEPIVRYGYYSPTHGQTEELDVEQFNDITFGLNYYASGKIKIQTNYVLRYERGLEIKNNIFYICLQFFSG